MAEIQKGDPEAFAELYDRYSGLAYSLSVRICGVTQAEDATQAAFISAWRSRGQYRASSGTPRGWLLAIVRNRSIDEVRKLRIHSENRFEPRAEDGDGEPAVERLPTRQLTDDEVFARETAVEISSSLDRLPSGQREVIVLGFFGGLSHRQIASELDLPAGTVKGRIRLGLAKLRSEADEALR